MSKSRIELLVSIILDPTAQDHEKDDAAMDLADCDDAHALKALIQVARIPSKNDLFALDSYGEAIAKIWLKKDCFDLDIYLSLHELARSSIRAVLQCRKPDWIVKYRI